MYCVKCGAEINDEAMFCSSCGAPTANHKPQENPKTATPVSTSQDSSGLKMAAKILMLISTIISGIYLIPLAWMLPMTLTYWNRVKDGQPVGTGFKVCTLLFVNTIAGILMLCDKD